ncbi:MAG: glycosyltransferase family 4 protein [Actinomycetota bacterium]|nr:glycosyltransferase family 4 protein [Actinomycetota bacterium]
MRIGLVCPYSWDIPGGVQYHVRDLAKTMIALGHHVQVLTPANDETDLPPYVTSAGRAVPIRYNGSVARLQFGPVAAARVRRWLRQGHFDVLHVHEPSAPSLSFLTCVLAKGPIVATFHTATVRSRWLGALQGVLQPFMERISGRIAVSDLARRVQVEHLGGDAIVIPNGVDVAHFAAAPPLPGFRRAGLTIGFLGRFDERRKGLPVLLDALAQIAPEHPDLHLLVAGRGDVDDLYEDLPEPLHERVTVLGEISEEDKARMLASIDIYCAPNLGGESFGVILVEAMAAGAAIVASDLDAFRRVLNDGAAGVLVRRGNAAALGDGLSQLLGDATRRAELVQAGRIAVQEYDWSVVSQRILAVYETVASRVGGEVEVTTER